MNTLNSLQRSDSIPYIPGDMVTDVQYGTGQIVQVRVTYTDTSTKVEFLLRTRHTDIWARASDLTHYAPSTFTTPHYFQD